MADLIQIDTDEEMDKYAEADLIAKNPPPVGAVKEKTVNYNPTTGRNDVLSPLSSGGYVKIGDEELPRTDKVKQYSRELESIGVPFDLADYEAAGFTADEVQAAGVMPVTQEKTGRTEPLREGEQLRMMREGADIAAPSRMFMRDDFNRVTVDGLSAIGVPAQQANQIADVLMGQVDTSGGTGLFDTGIGIVDFTPIGLAFGVEEVGDQLNRSIRTDDKVGMALGVLTLALSAAEAYPLTKAGARAVKKQIPAMRQALADLGQGAEARMAERGSTTLFSNPVEPAVDQALAMAGRAVGGSDFTVTKKDASGIFGQGSERVRYTDPRTQGTMEVVVRPDGSASVLELEVPEEFRGQGIGQQLQEKVMQDFPVMSGQVSSKAAATTAYRLGRRPPNNPDATLKDVFAEIDEMSSVNMVSPEMQARMEPRQVEAPTETKPGIIAFHGSGADFDRFELSKIGTGERAQVFGRGLYFTDSEDIAEFYRQSVRGRQNLSRGYEVSYKGNKVSDLGDTATAEAQPYENAAINKIADNISKVTTMATKDLPQSELVQLAKDKAIKTLEGEISRTAERTSGSMFDELSDLIGDSLNEELNALKAIDPNDVSFAEGKKYQVRLDVSPEELLNWDMPFDKQTPTAQRAILNAVDEITLDDAVNLGVDVFDAPYNGDEAAALKAAKQLLLEDFSVNRFLNTWSDIRGSDGAGEELLAKNGLKGITYKADQGPTARDPSAGGPNNYVIFDDKLINIMKKYGITGPVAVSALASQEQEEA